MANNTFRQGRGYTSPDAVMQAVIASAGSYGGEVDVLDHVLYDSLTFQATTFARQQIFFSTPFNGTTKTEQETNMSLQGQLPSKQWFVVNEFSLAALANIVGADVDQNTVMSALTNLIQYSKFSLKLAGRDFDTQYPGTAYLPGFFANGLASAANGHRVGDVVTSGWLKIRIPVVIEPQANFAVLQTTGSGTAAINTILDTASDVLATQNARLQYRMKGTLIRAK